MLFLVIVFQSLLNFSWSKVDYCLENHLPEAKDSENLQFTKELSSWEYAVDSKFKSLHCCAKGYFSIEWFKDGRAYPWPGDVSSFILYPESANQTVYTKNLRASDAGNYTCRLHNDTDTQHHVTELKVFDDTSGYMEKPLATYRPPQISYAALGGVTRLFCEAFVGSIDLPDAASDLTVKWERNGNATLLPPHIQVEHAQREKEIVGKYLLLNNVETADFGTYLCTISNTGDQKILMETQLKPREELENGFCIGSNMTLLVLLMAVFAGALLVYYTLKFIFNKKLWGKVRECSLFPKKSDARKMGLVLIHSPEDQTLIETVISPRLTEDGTFYLIPQQVSPTGGISEETRRTVGRHGRALVCLSRDLTGDWNEDKMETFLESLPNSDKTDLLLLLILQELPPEMVLPASNRLLFFNDPDVFQKLRHFFSGSNHPSTLTDIQIST